MVKPLSTYGTDRSQPNTNLSTSISIELFDENGNDISTKINLTNPIELMIPRDSNIVVPAMIFQNVSSKLNCEEFNSHYVNVTSEYPVSVHLELNPENENVSYLFAYQLDGLPRWNDHREWKIVSPSELTKEGIYKYFVDNEKTRGHQSVVFGIRELNSNEIHLFQRRSSSVDLPKVNSKFNFSCDYSIRIYLSGCYYLDENGNWKSEGLVVGSSTNVYSTQCYSKKIKTFSTNLQILPKLIDWNYVFANADFLRNKTIYLTVICVSMIYLILLIFSRWKDRKDLEKLGVTPLPDNHRNDKYFYQILVFTGQRKDSGTKSKVNLFLLHENHLIACH